MVLVTMRLMIALVALLASSGSANKFLITHEDLKPSAEGRHHHHKKLHHRHRHHRKVHSALREANRQPVRTEGGFDASYYQFSPAASCPVSVQNLNLAHTAALSRIDYVINYTASANSSADPSWSGLPFSSQYFAVWAGLLQINTSGTYVFTSSSDGGSSIAVDGSPLVSNDGCHGMKSVAGQLFLSKGLHQVDVRYFQVTGIPSLIVTYKGRDTDDTDRLVLPAVPGTTTTTTPSTSSTTTSTVTTVTATTVTSSSTSTGTTTTVTTTTTVNDGFSAKFYRFDPAVKCPQSVTALNFGQTAVLSRVDATVNFTSNGTSAWTGLFSSQFYAVWSGLVRINVSGTYAFSSTSDGGSNVAIDGTVLVNNDGCHSLQSASGQLFLAAGLHQVDVKYFEVTGVPTIAVTYNGADTNYVDQLVLPAVQGTTTTTTKLTTTTTLPTTSTITDTRTSTVTTTSTLTTTSTTTTTVNDGFSAKFYRFDPAVKCPQSVTALNFGQTAVLSRVDATVNFTSNGTSAWTGLSFSSQFYAVWSGLVRINVSGTYAFSSTSDGGSNVAIDGTVLVNNDGCHSLQSASGQLFLAAGLHQVDVKYFEVTGVPTIAVTYNGADTNYVDQLVLPAVQGTTTTTTKLTTTTTLPTTSTITDTRTSTVTTTSTLTTTSTTTTTVVDGFTAQFYRFEPAVSCPQSVTSLNFGQTALLSRVDLTVNFTQASVSNITSFWPGLSFSSQFYAIWSGLLRINTSGTYAFSSTSDGGSNVAIDGTVLVHNDGCHSLQFASGQLFLTAGLHQVDVKYFEVTGAPSLIVTYNGPDTNYMDRLVQPSIKGTTTTTTQTTTTTTIPPTTSSTSTQRTTITSTSTATITSTTTTTTLTTTTTAIQGGFIATFYQYDIKCPYSIAAVQLSSKGPAHTRLDEVVNYSQTESAWAGIPFNDSFAAQWKTVLTIKTSGTYLFATSSSDGSILAVDDQIIVNNDGCHDEAYVSGQLFLSKGTHSLILKFFEASRNAGLKLTYKGPDTNDVEIIIPKNVTYPVAK